MSIFILHITCHISILRYCVRNSIKCIELWYSSGQSQSIFSLFFLLNTVLKLWQLNMTFILFFFLVLHSFLINNFRIGFINRFVYHHLIKKKTHDNSGISFSSMTYAIVLKSTAWVSKSLHKSCHINWYWCIGWSMCGKTTKWIMSSLTVHSSYRVVGFLSEMCEFNECFPNIII